MKREDAVNPSLDARLFHLTAMDGGNAGIAWMHFPALKKTLRFSMPGAERDT
ncbi:hypothetical protein [Onishia niordana]|uniref:hypothetical protein n=1 Tax=Onishia niordana TaxID=2508711 RepID=UPI001444A957|nr:hypothetical protein [Halomonas niordiana]